MKLFGSSCASTSAKSAPGVRMSQPTVKRGEEVSTASPPFCCRGTGTKGRGESQTTKGGTEVPPWRGALWRDLIDHDQPLTRRPFDSQAYTYAGTNKDCRG